MLNEIVGRFNLGPYEEDETDLFFNIFTYKPQKMDDVQEICDKFLNGDAVILHFEQTGGSCEERIMDFLAGAIYSQNGNILKISNHIYAISPADVGLF